MLLLHHQLGLLILATHHPVGPLLHASPLERPLCAAAMLDIRAHHPTVGLNALSMMNAPRAKLASSSVAWIPAVGPVDSIQNVNHETTLLFANVQLAMRVTLSASATKSLRSSLPSQLRHPGTLASHHPVVLMLSAKLKQMVPHAPAFVDTLVIPIPTVALNAPSTLTVQQTRPVAT